MSACSQWECSPPTNRAAISSVTSYYLCKESNTQKAREEEEHQNTMINIIGTTRGRCLSGRRHGGAGRDGAGWDEAGQKHHYGVTPRARAGAGPGGAGGEEGGTYSAILRNTDLELCQRVEGGVPRGSEAASTDGVMSQDETPPTPPARDAQLASPLPRPLRTKEGNGP